MPYHIRPRRPPSKVAPLLEVFHDWWNTFVASFSNSLTAQTQFARAISCGSWNFENQEEYAAKLEAIFALSDRLLSDSDMLRLDQPSRSSTMASSVVSLLEEEEEGLVGEDEVEKERLSAVLEAGLMMNRRRFFLSKAGFVGAAPWNSKEGDVVCVLLGCSYPVILRREDDHYVLIGEAYIDDFMNGNAIDGLENGEFVLGTFEIH
jgi:hypothetical protein